MNGVPSKSNQSGFVLYLAMFVLVIIGLYTSLIVTSRYMAIRPAQHQLNVLKATVLAYSGLSMAQACVAGYDSNTINWETPGLTRKLDSAGSFTLRAEHDGGWLRVESRGIWFQDTVGLEGLLGHSSPAFCGNALSMCDYGANVVVADRSLVTGNVGTVSGDAVVTKGSGSFAGKGVRLEKQAFDAGSVDEQIRRVFATFGEQQGNRYWPDSLRPVKSGQFREALATGTGPVYIDGSLAIDDTLDVHGRTLWVRGNLEIGAAACVSNLKACVSADTRIDSMAFITGSILFGCGNVHLTGQCHVSMQIVCAESLTVTGNARVSAPSFLYLSPYWPRSAAASTKALVIAGNAEVHGVVMTGTFNSQSADSRVVMLGRSSLSGLLYTPETVTLYGNIAGSVYTAKTSYRFSRSVYEGWIMETAIRHEDVHDMVLPLVFPGAVSAYLYIISGDKRICL